jgi:hypothetical protein
MAVALSEYRVILADGGRVYSLSGSPVGVYWPGSS